MNSGFISDAAEWTRRLQGSPYDFYHLPAYAELEAQELGGRALAYVCDDGNFRALIPLIERRIGIETGGDGLRDLVSPYGYPGILLNKSIDFWQQRELLETFNKDCRESGFISAFIRLNPILNNDLFGGSEHLAQEIHGKTVYVDLSKPYEEICRGYSTNHKRNIKSLVKQQFKVEINHWDRYEDWQKIYSQTMSRTKASQYYFYRPEYFETLRNVLGEGLVLFTVSTGDAVAAGGLFTHFNGVMQYHLGATSDEYLTSAPAKLMFDEAIKWGGEKGARVLHLGGGLNAASDSLFYFKYGFSKNTFRFSSLRCIADPVAYEQQVKRAFPVMDFDPGTVNFFPLYRYSAGKKDAT